MATGPGRKREYRAGTILEVPVDHAIPTCEECGETYLTTAEAEALDVRLQQAHTEYCKRLVDSVRKRANVTQRELEVALGVTPTYLSHLVSGRKQASLQLVRLLQAYAVHPDEVTRHLRGGDWVTAMSAHMPCSGQYRPSGTLHVGTFRVDGGTPRSHLRVVRASPYATPPSLLVGPDAGEVDAA